MIRNQFASTSSSNKVVHLRIAKRLRNMKDRDRENKKKILRRKQL